MPRSQRLLSLLDLLRRRHGPVTAETLAQQLSVSTRTVYRDIAQLCAQGADIRGEAGLGFVLHTDLGLPPLMFDKPEIEALVFGMRWVAANGDDGLAADAKSVLAKIDAVLPGHLKEHLNTQALYPRPCQTRPFTPQESETLSAIRTALRGNRVLSFDYTDAQGRPTRRSVRPLAGGGFSPAPPAGGPGGQGGGGWPLPHRPHVKPEHQRHLPRSAHGAAARMAAAGRFGFVGV